MVSSHSSPLLSVARTKHVFRVIPVLFPESAVETICRKVPCSLVLMGKTMVSHGIFHLKPCNSLSHQAEKFYFGGLVLIAPFLSLRDALGQQLDR